MEVSAIVATITIITLKYSNSPATFMEEGPTKDVGI